MGLASLEVGEDGADLAGEIALVAGDPRVRELGSQRGDNVGIPGSQAHHAHPGLGRGDEQSTKRARRERIGDVRALAPLGVGGRRHPEAPGRLFVEARRRAEAGAVKRRRDRLAPPSRHPGSARSEAPRRKRGARFP